MQINAYVHYNGNCEEALEFYKAALGGTLAINRYDGSPMDQGLSADAKRKVLHATLETDGANIMASDSLPGHERTIGNNIQISVSLSDEAAADAIFAKLSAGGTVTMPMTQQFWGAKFGMLTDKFGIQWMVSAHTS